MGIGWVVIITGAEGEVSMALRYTSGPREPPGLLYILWVCVKKRKVVLSFRLRGKVNVLVDSVPMFKEVSQSGLSRRK
jgi:hypothetical protein